MPPDIRPLCSPQQIPVVASYALMTRCDGESSIHVSAFEPEYQGFVCNGDAANQSDREECIFARTPLFQNEVDDMKDKADAVIMFESIIDSIQPFASCRVFLELVLIMQTHCHPLANSFNMLRTGLWVAALGLTLTALFVCTCWRNITRPVSGKIAPGEDAKLPVPQSPST